MSRRSRTLLTFSLRLPVPAGWTQKQMLERVKESMMAGLPQDYPVTEVIIKLINRETTYL